MNGDFLDETLGFFFFAGFFLKAWLVGDEVRTIMNTMPVDVWAASTVTGGVSARVSDFGHSVMAC